MNLNKLKKDQLINKIKDQQNVISPKSSGTQIIKDFQNLFITLKGLFLKLTLLSLIIKYFRKYKFIRKLLFFFNWIIISLFGISIIDIYDTNLVSYLIEWIRSTHLYKILIEILEDKVEKIETKLEKIETKVEKIETKEETNQFQNKLRKNYSTTTGNQTSFDENKNNSWWFNRQEIDNNYSKYIIILSLLILSGLAWFYWDEIKEILPSIKNKKRPGLGGNEGNTIPELLDPSEEYPEYFREVKSVEVEEELYDLEVIRNQVEGKGKAVDYSQIEIDKWTDSPTTPKASSSKLSSQSVMMPITRED
jgi:hypothetical protein